MIARYPVFGLAFLIGSLLTLLIVSGYVIADMRSASEYRKMMEQAQRYLDMGQAEYVKGLIEPQLSKYPRPKAQAEAYRLLAIAEERQGRYRFAALYYYRMYRAEQTDKNLRTLADAYETAGEWPKALWAFTELAGRPQNAAALSDLQQHIRQIEHTCACTPAPPE